MSKETSVPDRRAAGRREVMLQARVRAQASPWIECTVRDVSPMGAALEFRMPVVLPDSVVLQIPDCLLEVECVVRHSDGCRVGVLFASNRQATMALFS